jgi:hypothetical protein
VVFDLISTNILIASGEIATFTSETRIQVVTEVRNNSENHGLNICSFSDITSSSCGFLTSESYANCWPKMNGKFR